MGSHGALVKSDIIQNQIKREGHSIYTEQSQRNGIYYPVKHDDAKDRKRICCL